MYRRIKKSNNIVRPDFWNNFHNSAITCYSNNKEGLLCIKQINKHIPEIREVLLKKPEFQKTLNNLQSSSDKYHHTRIFRNRNIKVNLNTLSAGSRIPPHGHPNAINILLVLQGSIQVTRFNPGQTRNRQYSKQLKPGEADTGLPRFRNAHAIKPLTSQAAFLSIQCIPHAKWLHFWWQCARVASVCGALMVAPVAMACGGNDSPFGDWNNVQAIVKQANQLRELDTPAASRKAVRLYRQIAPDSAEAQYWLSVMYFEGQGVPRDESRAMSLAYDAAKQGYRPARIFHGQLMNGDFDPFYGC